MLVHRGKRLESLAGVAKLTVRIVLENRHFVPRRQLDQHLPAFERQRRAFRIRERGDDVNQLWVGVLQRILELVDAHSLIIAIDRNKAGLLSAEGLKRSQIARVLDNPHVAAIEKDFSYQ